MKFLGLVTIGTFGGALLAVLSIGALTVLVVLWGLAGPPPGNIFGFIVTIGALAGAVVGAMAYCND